MIPKIQIPERRGSDEERSAFARGPDERPLRILVDQSSLRPSLMLDLLLEIGHIENIHMYTTTDVGLPYLAIFPIDRANDQFPLTIHRPDGITHMAVWPASTYETLARKWAPETSSNSPERVLSDLQFANAAWQLGADAFVTGSDFFSQNRGRERRSNPMDLASAVALLGLFLRLRGDFRYAGPGNPTLSKGFFYLILTWERLPDLWRWRRACHVHSAAVGDPKAERLSEAVLVRVDRAFRARDKVHELFKVSQTYETASEALMFLEVVLYSLAGAFDAVAKVAHIAYDMPLQDLRRASWRRGRWLSQTEEHDAALAQMMQSKSEGSDVLQLVSILRNTVHAEALRTIAYQDGSSEAQHLVQIYEEDERSMVEAVERLGGEDHWGIRRLGLATTGYGDLYLDVELFLERVLPLSLKALNELIRATRLDLLRQTETEIPEENPSNVGPWAPEVRERVRVLAGV